MDRRFWVLIAVCVLEAGFRILWTHLGVEGLVYTLVPRLVEMTVMLVFAFKVCGIQATSVSREFLIGIGSSLAFGALVFAIDLISRIAFSRGILALLLMKHQVEGIVLFFVTGCIVAPLAEELFFRGLLYSWMRERVGAFACIALSSLFFASMHGSISPVQLAGGVLFASLFEWRRSIWAGYVLHALGNLGIWVIPFIYPLR